MFHLRICTLNIRSSCFHKNVFTPFKELSTSSLYYQNQDDNPSTIQEQHSLSNLSGSLIHQDLPILTSRKLEHMPRHMKPKEAWLETLNSLEDKKLGILDLHPEIFSAFPRVDVLWQNIRWQMSYRRVDYRRVKNRAEMRGGGRKPWPQKGTGRARHGSIRSPIWLKGGAVSGPRGPTSYFYMLPTSTRTLGLRTALTMKFAQDNLHIVDSLEVPTNDPKYIEELVESRGWGLSVLFIDDTDYISENLATALNEIKQYNAMPVYGLNVYSMLKHETLVLTLPALEQLEKKILQKMYSAVKIDSKMKTYST